MNILIIGLGSIGKKHLQAIRNLVPEASVYALRSNPKSPMEEGVQNVYDLEDLTVKLDFAIISNPTSLHKQTLEALIPLEIPLFIEKPVLMELQGADDLRHQVQRRGIPTYVACNLRFLDCLVFMKNQLRKSRARVLEVNAYCGSYLPNWRPGQDFKSTYSAIPELGGGVHLDLIHELDYLYWMFGKPLQSRAFLSSKSSLDIAAIDYANYQLIYEDFLAQVVLNYFRKSSKRTLEILTDTGTWEVDLINNRVIFEQELKLDSEQSVLDTYSIQLRYFLDCIQQNKESFNSLGQGIEVLKICLNEEVYDSLAR